MKRVVVLLCLLMWLNAVSAVTAQGFYPDFALVVQLPSYETFMTNLGDSPIRVDAYSISIPVRLTQPEWLEAVEFIRPGNRGRLWVWAPISFLPSGQPQLS